MRQTKDWEKQKIIPTLWLLDKVILFNLITLFDYNAISIAKRSSHGNLINYNVKMNKKYMKIKKKPKYVRITWCLPSYMQWNFGIHVRA